MLRRKQDGKIQKEMVPDMHGLGNRQHFQSARNKIFQVDGGGVACEDINIATALVCRAGRWSAEKQNIVRNFKPAMFDGVKIGKLTQTKETVFLFYLVGDPVELKFRRMLFFKGAHFTDSNEFRTNRSRLLDALKETQRRAEKGEYVHIINPGNGG